MDGIHRPLGVTIIGVLLFLLGLFMILAGLALFAIGDVADVEELTFATGAVTAVIGLVYVVLAFGFFRGWDWVWFLTMIVLILGIIWNIVQWVLNGMESDQIASLLIGLILPVIIVLYMNSTKVKTFFKRT